jgi:Tfp pilus assembly protein PilX
MTAVSGVCLTPRSSKRDAGFGLVSIVLSLLIVALLSVGALKEFAGGATTGAGSKALNTTVAQAYDVQVQSALSSTMQNVRDGAISNGGLSASDLAQYGVQSGPSDSPSTVSGALAATAGSGAAGPLGFGSVTLAAASKSGTCWFIWFSTSATWYGFEPDATSCVAPPLATAPTASAGSPGAIGWQEGSFPITG